MKFTTYSTNNNAKKYVMWMNSAEGDFEAIYRDRTECRDEKDNFCDAQFEYEGRPMTGTLIMTFGSILTRPVQQGLGSLLLFYAANYGLSRGAKEMRVVDNKNPAVWKRMMPLAITVPNRPHDKMGDRRVDIRKFRDFCKQRAMGKGWNVNQPNIVDVANFAAHKQGLKAPLP